VSPQETGSQFRQPVGGDGEGVEEFDGVGLVVLVKSKID
jgi:hypothetical protein